MGFLTKSSVELMGELNQQNGLTDEQSKGALTSALVANSDAQREFQAWGMIGGAASKAVDGLLGWYMASKNFDLMNDIYGEDGIEQTKIDKSFQLQSQLITTQQDITSEQLATQAEIAKTNAYKEIRVAETKADAKVAIEKDKNIYNMFYPRNQYYYGMA